MNPFTVETMLDLARRFMESRILLTGAELDLFTLCDSAPLTAEEISTRVKGELRPLRIILDALAALSLLVKEDGKYSCRGDAASLLSRNSPESILPMVNHMAHVWRRWSQLTEIACPDACSGQPDSTDAQREKELKDFIGAMHNIGARMAPAIVAASPPGHAKKLLDVGGGSGTYTIAFLSASPGLKATLFDRPPVIEMARARLEAAGLLERVRLQGGDFSRDELPGGHDLALLSAIIHQNSREENVELYRKIFRALEPGGRIVIRDHVMERDRTRPRDGAIFAVNMLVGTSGGDTYTFEEIKGGLGEAGFAGVRLLMTGERLVGLVEGIKPEKGM